MNEWVVTNFFFLLLLVIRISWCWQTCSMCCITANVLQRNKVDAQCDKLATKLRWQRFASKVANLQLWHRHITYSTRISSASIRDDPIWILPRFSAPENWSPWAIVRHYLRDPMLAVSVEHRLVKDEQTDGQTNTWQQIMPALASIARVKTKSLTCNKLKTTRTW